MPLIPAPNPHLLSVASAPGTLTALFRESSQNPVGLYPDFYLTELRGECGLRVGAGNPRARASTSYSLTVAFYYQKVLPVGRFSENHRRPFITLNF